MNSTDALLSQANGRTDVNTNLQVTNIVAVALFYPANVRKDLAGATLIIAGIPAVALTLGPRS